MGGYLLRHSATVLSRAAAGANARGYVRAKDPKHIALDQPSIAFGPESVIKLPRESVIDGGESLAIV
jgi:hypothetical protein